MVTALLILACGGDKPAESTAPAPSATTDPVALLSRASIDLRGVRPTDEEIAQIREPVLERYKRDVEAYTSTSEIWDDGILDPVDTRNALGLSISAALNAPIGDPHYGVFRM